MFSSRQKLIRITAYCLRFCNNTKPAFLKLKGFLIIQELDKANNLIFKITQDFEIREEIKLLKAEKNLNPNSKILKLNPFLDKEEILRVVIGLKVRIFRKTASIQ